MRNVLLAGVGGQGTVLAAKVLAQAAQEKGWQVRTAETIGLTVSESLMLLPTKSVTAVVGRSRTATPCHRQGCEACDKTDCPFRRG